jgi:hypothetical protein
MFQSVREAAETQVEKAVIAAAREGGQISIKDSGVEG